MGTTCCELIGEAVDLLRRQRVVNRQSLPALHKFETQPLATAAILPLAFRRPSELWKRLLVEVKHLILCEIAAGIGLDDAAAGGVEAEAGGGVFGETGRQRQILKPREEDIGRAGHCRKDRRRAPD